MAKSNAVQKEVPSEMTLIKAVALGAPPEVLPRTEVDQEGGSKQLEGLFDREARGQYVVPRYKPEVWARALEINTRLARCVRTYARNTVGLGWYIEPIPPHPDARRRRTLFADSDADARIPEETKKRIVMQSERLRRFFSSPNPEYPFPTLAKRFAEDREATGIGYIEVVRNLKGEISQIYHVPSVTVRRRQINVGQNKSRVEGYIQIRGTKKSFFKEFGDKRVMDSRTGVYATNPADVPIEFRATEIIHHLIYSPTSIYYGAPRHVSAAPAIAGSRLSAQWNVNFFENDAVPRMAILVTGGKLDDRSIQTIENFYEAKAKGVENAHRCILLQAELATAGFTQQEKAKLELKPLTVGSTQEASFLDYRQANDEEIRECYGLARIFFTSENVNKSSAYACLTGDTKVPLLDGRVLTLEELAVDFPEKDQYFWVYSIDQYGVVVIGKAYAPRVSYANAPVLVVTLANGEKIRATGNHRFMLSDQSYARADTLEPGTLLMGWDAKAKATTPVAVASVEPGGSAKVYDLTVDAHENFALASGVFVHNSREITNDQELEPERLEMEYLFNQKIVRDLLVEEPLVRFRFERLQVTDPSERARIDQTYAKIGAITPNEIRDALGKPKYPPEYTFADKPMDIALAELKAGVALLIQQQGNDAAQQMLQQAGKGATDDKRERPSGKKEPAPKSGPKRVTDAIRSKDSISLKSFLDDEKNSEENVDNLIGLAVASVMKTTEVALQSWLSSMEHDAHKLAERPEDDEPETVTEPGE